LDDDKAALSCPIPSRDDPLYEARLTRLKSGEVKVRFYGLAGEAGVLRTALVLRDEFWARSISKRLREAVTVHLGLSKDDLSSTFQSLQQAILGANEELPAEREVVTRPAAVKERVAELKDRQKKEADVYIFELSEDKDAIANDIARRLAVERPFATHRESDQLWIYNPERGVYERTGEAWIKAKVEASTIIRAGTTKEGYYVEKPVRPSTHLVTEIINHIKRQTITKPEDFNPDAAGINLLNGILQLQEGQLRPHAPNDVCTIQIPVRYDPKAECPEISRFLSEILRPEDVSTILELAGYCLYKDYSMQTAFMLVGTGANGKGTLIRLLIRFLGAENVASVDLTQLEARFVASELEGKLANMCGDLPKERQMRHTGMFKKLTGQDYITTERKNMPLFQFVNYAKLVFIANELPYTEDPTDAFWRRWILIEFRNCFPPGKAVPQERLLAKLCTPSEMSGFLNLALVGLQRLLQRGHFELRATAEEVKSEWYKRADPIRTFIEECVDTSMTEALTPVSSLYREYVNYCKNVRATSVNEAQFSKEFRRHTGAYTSRVRGGAGRTNAWVGVFLPKSSQQSLAKTEGGQGGQGGQGVSSLLQLKKEEEGGIDIPRPPRPPRPERVGLLKWIESREWLPRLACIIKLKEFGLTQEQAEQTFQEMLRNGDIYEPKPDEFHSARPKVVE